jgi:putative acetyltransferase
MNTKYRNFLIRSWQTQDRYLAAQVIQSVLLEYGLPWQPESADLDVIEIEKFYIEKGGEFWVVETNNTIIGTAAYYPISRGNNAVEIRKMYLLPLARKQGLGKFLLQELEKTITNRGFAEIWIETASILKEAVILYENHGYLPASGVETARCDLIYCKIINLN